MPKNPENEATGKRLHRTDSYFTNNPSKKKSDSKKKTMGINNVHNNIITLLLTDDEDTSNMIRKIFKDESDVLSAQGGGRRNILHTMIENIESEDARKPPAIVREFLQRLIMEHPQVLSHRDESEQTPLDKAAKKGKPSFFLLMDHIMPDAKIKELKKSGWRNNVQDPETTKRLEQIEEYFQSQEAGDPKTTTSDPHDPQNPSDAGTQIIDAKAKDQDQDEFRSLNGRGPDSDYYSRSFLHQSSPRSQAQPILDIERLDQWTKTLHSTLESALSIGDGQSNKTSCLHVLLKDENSFALDHAASSDSSRLISNFGRLISMCPRNIFELHDQDGLTPLHHAVRLYRHDQIDYESINKIIRQLVETAPHTIYSTCEKRRGHDAWTPYRLLKETCKDLSKRSDRSIPHWYNELEKFLKSAVIGDQRSRDEKIQHLYGGPKEAKMIFFDIPPVNGKVDKEYISSLENRVALNFEAALEYVRLPEHDAESNSLHESQHRSRSNRFDTFFKHQCDPYVKIFDWLADDKDVEKIFKIVVDDLGPNPHSDDGIRKALTRLKQDDQTQSSSRESRFNIEAWDWRRLDICSDTIAAAAPDVRELCLYSSGNPAVFKGWGCKHGLAKLKKLQSVKIMVFSREKDNDACAEAFENFRRKFCLRYDINKEKVTIEYANHSVAGQQWDKDLKKPGSDEHIDPEWFQRLALLTEFLEDRFLDHAKVKIALIDNGVDSAHPELGNIESGISFYADNNKHIPFRDFFTGPSEHGTKMALCLRKVCPMARLYVARLDDSMSGTEKFTVQSAVKSVQWATSMDVDIISMSWSFNRNEVLEKHRGDFEQAIRKAKDQNILLFGSMTDVKQKPNLQDHVPLSLSEVITIGSADQWSGKPEYGAGRTSNYLFPGHNITLRSTRGEKVSVSGSSLATAFAAGLAGLVLFTLQIHYFVNGERVDEKEKMRLSTSVKTNGGMSKIFDVLGEQPAGAEKDLYVGLGKIFPEDRGKFEDYPSMLDGLVKQICHRLL